MMKLARVWQAPKLLKLKTPSDKVHATFCLIPGVLIVSNPKKQTTNNFLN